LHVITLANWVHDQGWDKTREMGQKNSQGMERIQRQSLGEMEVWRVHEEEEPYWLLSALSLWKLEVPRCPKVLGTKPCPCWTFLYIIGNISKNNQINWGHILKISMGVKSYVNLKASKWNYQNAFWSFEWSNLNISNQVQLKSLLQHWKTFDDCTW
jgi:hypothetical protein